MNKEEMENDFILQCYDGNLEAVKKYIDMGFDINRGSDSVA